MFVLIVSLVVLVFVLPVELVNEFLVLGVCAKVRYEQSQSDLPNLIPDLLQISQSLVTMHIKRQWLNSDEVIISLITHEYSKPSIN